MKSADSSYKKSNDGIVFKLKFSNTKRKPANQEIVSDNPKTLLNRIAKACQTNNMEYIGIAYHHFGEYSPEDIFNQFSSQSKDNFRTYLQTGSLPTSKPSSCAQFTEGLLDSAFLLFSKMEESKSNYFRPILNAANISSFNRGALLHRARIKMQSCEPYMNYNAFVQVLKASHENNLSKSTEGIEAFKNLIATNSYPSSSQQAIDCTDYAIGASYPIIANEVAKIFIKALERQLSINENENEDEFVIEFVKAYETAGILGAITVNIYNTLKR